MCNWLVHGCEPVLCNCDISKMREHLIVFLEKGFLDNFPCTKSRRVSLCSSQKVDQGDLVLHMSDAK